MVDDVRDALECFGSAPVDLLAIGPFVLRRLGLGRRSGRREHPVSDLRVAVVVPTIGRPSLRAAAVARSSRRRARCRSEVVVVDDRRGAAHRSSCPSWARWPAGCDVRRSGGRGPAAARNVGWRAVSAAWVAFLDDDVLVTPTWLDDLAADLGAARPGTSPARRAGSRCRCPPAAPPDRLGARHRRARDARVDHRGHGLPPSRARRGRRLRRALPARVPGGRRPGAAGARRRAPRWSRGTPPDHAPGAPGAAGTPASRQQRGNADDALMRRLHGADWYAPRRRRTGPAAAARGGSLRRPASRRWRWRPCDRRWAGAGGAGVARRDRGVRLGPHRARTAGSRGRSPRCRRRASPSRRWRSGTGCAAQSALAARPGAWRPVDAVLVDRDGTIVVDVPYNGDPELVEPVPGALAALDRVRAAGLPVGVVTNQSGVGRGLIARRGRRRGQRAGREAARPVRRLAGLPARRRRTAATAASPRPVWCWRAAAALGVRPERCVVIGDIGADVGAAAAAGARAVLVPTPVTAARGGRPRRRRCGRTLGAAVDLVLSGRAGVTTRAGRPPRQPRRRAGLRARDPGRRRHGRPGDGAGRAGRRGRGPAAARASTTSLVWACPWIVADPPAVERRPTLDDVVAAGSPTGTSTRRWS